MTQVYLAGPMTGIPAFNFPLFFAATEWLRNVKGWQVLSPAEKDLEKIPWDEMQKVPGFDTGDLKLYCEHSTFTMGNAMEWDLPAILDSDGIALLPGWEKSTGARWERIVAEALDRDIYLLTTYGDESLPNFLINRETRKTQLTDFLRGFGLPETPTAELVRELRRRLDHVPPVKGLLSQLEASVVL